MTIKQHKNILDTKLSEYEQKITETNQQITFIQKMGERYGVGLESDRIFSLLYEELAEYDKLLSELNPKCNNPTAP